MRILGFGTYDLSRHPRVGVLLEGLRARGDDVTEANAPLGYSTAERVAMLSKPWLAPRFALQVISKWAIIARRARAARRREPLDAIVVGYLGHFDVVLARLLFPFDTVVLDLLIFAADTAKDRGSNNRLLLSTLGVLDRVACRCADVILVDTAEHRDLVTDRQLAKVLVVPVGAPTSWQHNEASAQADDAVLKVVFFGLFTPLQGAEIIGEALGLLADDPNIEITMIGSGQQLAATRDGAAANNNVTWISWVPPDALPSVVAAHHVCLGIFGTTPKAIRVVPNKVYQGAAAGCAIITSDTPPQRRALLDAALFVPAGDPVATAAAIRALAFDRTHLASLQLAARARREAFTPFAVTDSLQRALSGRQQRASNGLRRPSPPRS